LKRCHDVSLETGHKESDFAETDGELYLIFGKKNGNGPPLLGAWIKT
jgi:hypothetical protein